MRVLVTGATGFVGSALVPALIQRGYSVRAAMREQTSIHFIPDVEVRHHGDLASPIDWMPLIGGCDAIVHLAGVAHTGSEVAAEYHDFANRRQTEQLIAAAKNCGTEKLVFISSIRAQSGPATSHVLSEADAPSPTDSYGKSKLAAEDALRASGLRYTILRPVLIYGAGVKGNLAALARLADSAWPLPFGALTNRRSLLNRASLIDAIEFALRSPACDNETFIVADRDPVAFNDLVAALRRGLGRAPRLVPVPPPMLRAFLQITGKAELADRLEGDLIASPEKLAATGWSPAQNTLDAMERLARQMRAA